MGLFDYYYDIFGDWDFTKWGLFLLLNAILIGGCLWIFSRITTFDFMTPMYIGILVIISPAAVAFFLANPHIFAKNK